MKKLALSYTIQQNRYAIRLPNFSNFHNDVKILSLKQKLSEKHQTCIEVKAKVEGSPDKAPPASIMILFRPNYISKPIKTSNQVSGGLLNQQVSICQRKKQQTYSPSQQRNQMLRKRSEKAYLSATFALSLLGPTNTRNLPLPT